MMNVFKFSYQKSVFLMVLVSAVALSACKNNSVSSIDMNENPEKTTLSAQEVSNLMSSNEVLTYTLVETLDVDARLVGNPAGLAYSENILESGVEYRITVDGNWSAWDPSWWSCTSPYPTKYLSPSVTDGTNAGFNAEWRYADAGNCGREDITWPGIMFSLDGGANLFDPTPVDGAFNSDHIYEYIVTGTGQKAGFYIPDTNGDNHGVLQVTIEEIGLEPETNVYVSNAGISAYGPVLPSSADSNWPTSVCYQENPFPLSANWGTEHNSYVVTNNGAPHPWDNGTFEADWINSYGSMDSGLSGGPGGHNWSKYETQVSGTGTFVVQLLADNCSWVYLSDENGDNPELVGFQGAVSNPGEYAVTLSGDHTLSFVIFDGGGLAGGKFRLETEESYGGNTPDPIQTNIAPVADAGSYETTEATGPTTSITLDGSGSYDEDEGDVLTYAWEVNGTSVSGETATVNLPVGTHTITLIVTDQHGASDTATSSVTVKDETAAVIDFDQAVTSLWPPNHKMVLVATGIMANDVVDGAVDVTVTVSSNEASNGKGDGNTDADYEVVSMPDGSYNVYVRAERSGKGNGRTYTITMSASDAAGNTATESMEVSVEKSKGRK